MSKTYYHLTSRPMDSIYVGKQDKTDWELSYYWQSILDDSYLIDDCKDFPQEISSIFLYMKYCSQLLKEYIFEDVRASEFSQVPSRKRCMFLFEIEQDEEAEAYLRKMGCDDSKLSGRSLIKLEPIKGNSVTHRTDMKLLNINLSKQPEIVTAARKYWHGTSDPIELSEVLLEGEFIIRKIIKTYPQPK